MCYRRKFEPEADGSPRLNRAGAIALSRRDGSGEEDRRWSSAGHARNANADMAQQGNDPVLLRRNLHNMQASQRFSRATSSRTCAPVDAP
jgi:hypothetical protein